MKIGYGFWGFLGDKKFNSKGEELSTPDGNAFYSWSIIRALQKAGHEVYALMPDRDAPGIMKMGKNLFETFATEERYEAYGQTKNYIDYDNYLGDLISNVHDVEDAIEDEEVDVVIWEWRMPIPGRNIDVEIVSPSFQPDFMLQDKLLNHFKQKHIPVYVFDLDYKVNDEDIEKYNIAGIIELGNKWINYRKCKATSVYIPFGFECINDFEIKDPTELMVYIGNRYERDWCIDKYIPGNLEGVTVHGNWLESGRDSAQKWPNIKFGKRLQLSEMYEAYSKAAVTPLLAKEEYCKHSFMTARLIEAVFYGCVPLIIEEFDFPNAYLANDLVEKLTIHSKEELVEKAKYYMEHPDERKEIIRILRHELRQMDAKFFVEDFMNLINE